MTLSMLGTLQSLTRKHILYLDEMALSLEVNSRYF